MRSWSVIATLALTACQAAPDAPAPVAQPKATSLKIADDVAEQLISDLSEVEAWDSIGSERPSKPAGAYKVAMEMVRHKDDDDRLVGGTADIVVGADRRVLEIALRRGYGFHCNNFADAPTQLGQLIAALEPTASPDLVASAARQLSGAFIPDGTASVDVGTTRFQASGGCVNQVIAKPI